MRKVRTHDNSTIRVFIRESLMLEYRDPGAEADAREKNLDTGRDKFGNIPKETSFKELSLVGKKFSFTYKGEPNFVVYADNKVKNQCIVRPYNLPSQKNSLSDIQTKIYGQLIDVYDAAVDDAINSKNGWETSEKLSSIIDVTRRLAISDREKTLPDFALVRRNLDFFKPPKEIATIEGREKGKNFQCVLPFHEVIAGAWSIIWDKNTPANDPEWLMTAACCYEYANGIKGALFSALFMGALFTALSIETGPGSIAGFLLGASLGASMHDIVTRIIVCIWAAKTNHQELFYANLAMIIITVIFESIGAYAEVKGGLMAAKTFDALPGKGLQAFLGSKIDDFAAYNILFAQPVLVGLDVASLAKLTGPQTKDVIIRALVSIALQLAAAIGDLFGFTISEERLKFYFENSDLLTGKVEGAESEFVRYIEQNYPAL